MSRLLVSVRGHHAAPVLLDVDTVSGIVTERRFPELASPGLPGGKQGFSGLRAFRGGYAVAMADKVVVLDAELGIKNVYSHPLMCDVHGICVDEPSIIHIVSSNIDGLLQLDVDAPPDDAWYLMGVSLGAPHLAHKLPREDLRGMAGDELPQHMLHLNDMALIGNGLYATYLGKRSGGLKARICSVLGIKNRVREGGVASVTAHLDKGQNLSWHLRKVLQCEGLHNAIVHNRRVYHTEYFGHALWVGKPVGTKDHLVYKRIALSLPQWGRSHLLRGVCPHGEGGLGGWVGLTPKRLGSGGATDAGYLLHYGAFRDEATRWIKLPAGYGPYDILEIGKQKP